MRKKIINCVLCVMVLVTIFLNVESIEVSASVNSVSSSDVFDATTLIETLKTGGNIVLWQDITTDELIVEQDSSINLNGYKLVAAGIVISKGKTLTIMDSQYTDSNPGSGKLITTGQKNKAGIQTTNATLIIDSGVIEAKGNTGGAGIGGSVGKNENCAGTVTINGGIVTATGVYGGAGIGGGDGGMLYPADLQKNDENDETVYPDDLLDNGGDGGIVTINGGTVIATGGMYDGRGIGGGTSGRLYKDTFNVELWAKGGDGATVTINDGIVYANSGSLYKTTGIGAGYGKPSGLGGCITINGGVVKVNNEGRYGYVYGYDIGGNKDAEEVIDGSLTVNGGTLEFCTNHYATNMSNLSFKNCTVLGSCQYEGTYNEKGKISINVSTLSASSESGKVGEWITFSADVTISRTKIIDETPSPLGKVVFKLDGTEIGSGELVYKKKSKDGYIVASADCIWLANAGNYTLTAEYQSGPNDVYENEVNFVSKEYTVNGIPTTDSSNCHKVIFQDGNRSTVQMVNHGEAAIVPDWYGDRTGYTLSWDKEFDNVTEDLTVNAIWTKLYKVKFLDGYDCVTEYVYYGESAIAPEWERTGYTLTWDKEFDCVTEDLTVNAVWVPYLKYNVIFKDGTTSVTQTVYYEQAAIAPEWERTGYTLTWDKEFDCITEDLTVNAVWTKKTYAIRFITEYQSEIDGYVYDQEYVYVKYGESAIAPEWTREGYTLTWDKEFDNVTEGKTVNAVWVKKKYTVVFKNGEEVLDTQQIEYLESAVAPTEPTKEGYTFDGWDKWFGSVTYNMVVNAEWLPNKYRISTISRNGGTVSGDGAKDYNTVAELIAKPNAGFIFDGWYENSVRVSSNTTYSFTVTKDRILEARFVPAVITSISIDGEKQLEDMLIVECGKTLDLTILPTPEEAIVDETKVQWSTSDPTIAKVENGIVIGINQGVVTISASVEGMETSCVVTVVPTVGYNTCGYCSGLGKMQCWNCNGTGNKICRVCGGDGIQSVTKSCTKCNGLGEITTPATCALCRGTGYYYSDSLQDYVTCRGCSGTGLFLYPEECGTCEGTGDVLKNEKCASCNGKGHYVCSYCNKGYNECYSCRGEGKVKRQLYIISYDANGGINSPYTQVKIENSKLQISNSEPTRKGYVFRGWALDRSANVAEYMPGDYITDDKSIQLYAVWELKPNLDIEPYTVKSFTFSSRAADSVTLNWEKNANASGYVIQQYKGGKWTTIKTITSNGTVSFKVTGLSPSTTYKFRIKAYKVDGSVKKYGAYVSKSVKTVPSTVKKFTFSARTATSVTLKWTKNTSADGYVIQQYKGGKWTTIKTITSNSTVKYKVTSLKPSVNYKFRIKAYKKDGSSKLYGTYSTKSVKTVPSKVKGFTYKIRAAKTITLRWYKNTSADGYVIQQNKGGKWVTIKTITNKSTVSYKVTGLKKSTSYRFRIKAYKKDGSKKLYSVSYTNKTVKTLAK